MAYGEGCVYVVTVTLHAAVGLTLIFSTDTFKCIRRKEWRGD